MAWRNHSCHLKCWTISGWVFNISFVIVKVKMNTICWIYFRYLPGQDVLDHTSSWWTFVLSWSKQRDTSPASPHICERIFSGGWRCRLMQISSHASHQSMATHVVFHHPVSLSDGFHVGASGAYKSTLWVGAVVEIPPTSDTTAPDSASVRGCIAAAVHRSGFFVFMRFVFLSFYRRSRSRLVGQQDRLEL